MSVQSRSLGSLKPSHQMGTGTGALGSQGREGELQMELDDGKVD